MLSSLPAYIKYAQHRANGQFDRASKCLEVILSESGHCLGTDQLAFLHGLLGELQYELGNKTQALESFETATDLSPYSYLTKYHFAKFLTSKAELEERGFKMIDQALAELKNDPFDGSDDDFSSEKYKEMFQELR